ncbi:MAG: hypothetical protein E7647_07120 [Ruminococcaceae bacterium]|nr:hypothetical protein [Oscillospiraceae bacterium]
MEIKRILAFILAAVMLLSVFGCAKKDKNGDADGDSATDSPAAVWSETTVVTENMFTYFYNAYYRYYLETYSQSLTSIGLDPSKSLASQKQSEEYTWQQYITIQVYKQLREMIALADSAKAEDFKLTEDDKKAVDAEMESFDKIAKDAGFETTDKYLEAAYGKGVNVSVVRKATELRILANRYYQKLWDGYTFTDEECEARYNEQRDSFIHYDYIKITVTEEESERLVEAADEESFVAVIREIITNNNFIGDYDRFSDKIEEQVKNKYHYRADYDPNYEVSKWAVEEGRAPYDIHTKTESTGNVTVSMILPTTDPGAINEVIYRDDVPLKNLMYMVFADSEGTDGITKAQSIYKNWQENPTEKRFEELYEKYDGGKAENVTKGAFNEAVNAWVFAEERKAGDCEIIEADGGAYLLYMLEDGEPSWLAEVKASLREEAYAADMEKILDKYPTEYNGDFIYNIVEVSVTDNSN